MSSPPIFADIGEASILFSNTTVSTNITTYLHRNASGDKMEFTLSNMTAKSVAEPFCAIDGLSDVSDLTQNLVNNVAAVVRNRINSFINGGEKYGVNTKIQKVINKLIDSVPMPIPIGKSGLYLDGFFYDNVQSNNDQFIIKLKT